MGSITAGSLNINSGAFTVSSAGVMTATGATVSGAITATSGSFTGDIVANNLNISSATVVGTLSANNLKIDDVTIDTDGNGNLILGNFDAFSNVNAGTIGIIDGTAGETGNVTEFNEFYRTGYTTAKPYHIASIASSGNYAIGDVLGSSSVTTVTGDVPLFSHQFTTANYSGNRTYIIHGEVDYNGGSSSATETLFAIAVKATSNVNDYTSTSASDYLASEKFSASGSYALANRGVNAKITVAGNTTITVWCFGAGDDVSGSNTAGTFSFTAGAITAFGLNK